MTLVEIVHVTWATNLRVLCWLDSSNQMNVGVVDKFVVQFLQESCFYLRILCIYVIPCRCRTFFSETAMQLIYFNSRPFWIYIFLYSLSCFHHEGETKIDVFLLLVGKNKQKKKSCYGLCAIYIQCYSFSKTLISPLNNDQRHGFSFFSSFFLFFNRNMDITHCLLSGLQFCLLGLCCSVNT